MVASRASPLLLSRRRLVLCLLVFVACGGPPPVVPGPTTMMAGSAAFADTGVRDGPSGRRRFGDVAAGSRDADSMRTFRSSSSSWLPPRSSSFLEAAEEERGWVLDYNKANSHGKESTLDFMRRDEAWLIREHALCKDKSVGCCPSGGTEKAVPCNKMVALAGPGSEDPKGCKRLNGDVCTKDADCLSCFCLKGKKRKGQTASVCAFETAPFQCPVTKAIAAQKKETAKAFPPANIAKYKGTDDAKYEMLLGNRLRYLESITLGDIRNVIADGLHYIYICQCTYTYTFITTFISIYIYIYI